MGSRHGPIHILEEGHNPTETGGSLSMAIRPRVAVISAVLLCVQLAAAQHAQAPKTMQPEVEQHIEKVISCLPAAVVVKGDPHSCSKLARRMAELHVSGVSIAVIHNGSIEWAQGFGVRNEAG